ncbi:YqaE/Pmp3 family membrane protein [Sphingomonas morindae]|uniref:YqaE/Pmp3 family membrane protein n=1 Tax=Sphingomonas morindae TaxID=1541170 RepID=A0ABY4X9F3_9SPHN|nr:YqaE/Pmp3 family membrane protein [Sphingomonas morindae]USI73341.1 YqaE/Pmp3 family membrane protein [Sphingomonas morindae]
MDRPSILAIILAVLLPPVGVWLARGIGPAFWLSLLLTLLAYVPGMIFSLVVVLRPGLLGRSSL